MYCVVYRRGSFVLKERFSCRDGAEGRALVLMGGGCRDIEVAPEGYERGRYGHNALLLPAGPVAPLFFRAAAAPN